MIIKTQDNEDDSKYKNKENNSNKINRPQSINNVISNHHKTESNLSTKCIDSDSKKNAIYKSLKK